MSIMIPCLTPQCEWYSFMAYSANLDIFSAAAGLARIRLSQGPSHNLAELSQIFGPGLINCTRLDTLAAQ